MSLGLLFRISTAGDAEEVGSQPQHGPVEWLCARVGANGGTVLTWRCVGQLASRSEGGGAELQFLSPLPSALPQDLIGSAKQKPGGGQRCHSTARSHSDAETAHRSSAAHVWASSNGGRGWPVGKSPVIKAKTRYHWPCDTVLERGTVYVVCAVCERLCMRCNIV